MKLYLKQKVFSWRDKFTAYDEGGGDMFYIESELFTWGKKLHVSDVLGNEVAYIEQKLFTFLPRYFITTYGVNTAEIVKNFTFFHQSYTINGPDWNAEGDFFDHEYTISSNGYIIAAVSKHWFTLGDAYEIDIADGIDIAMVLSVVLVIDACIAAQNNN